MAKFMVKASEFKNVCKAVNDRKLAELKKEIIEILKKQDEKDFKKATDYLNSQEEHFTHLEKSLSGKWIEKAGYGIGTVRVWKGKKYKKIAPDKWVRVFDKEGRGTNIAIGKLIAKVQKIDNVEDLMAFVMANKQRFVDENGMDLPVLDKLRAAVDARNGNVGSKEHTERETVAYNQAKNGLKKEKERLKEYEEQGADESELKKIRDNISDYEEKISRIEKERSNVGSKENSKPAEKTDEKYDRELVDSWKNDYKNFSTDVLKEKIEEYTKVLERAKNDNPSPDQRVAVKQNEHRLKALNELLEEKKNKPAEKYDDDKAYKEYQKLLMKENPTDADNERLSELVTEHYKHSKKEWIGGKGLKELNAAKDEDEVLSNGKTVKEVREQYGIESEKPAEKKKDENVENFLGKTLEAKKKELEKLKSRLADLKSKDIELTHRSQGNWGDGMRLSKLPSIKTWEDNREKMDGVKAKIDILEKQIYDEEHKPYWIQDIKGNRLTNEDAKEKIKVNLKKIDELSKGDEARKDIKIRDMKNENDYLMERLNQNDKRDMEIEAKFYENEESEAEKHQNRSDAMKGNKNAYKGGRIATSNPEKLKPIAKSESIGEGKVKMSYSKEVSDEIKHLTNTSKDAVTKGSRYDFLTKIYYDKGNLVSTDGNKLKIVKVGELDGIDNGTFVDIDNSKEGITITADKEFTKEHKFPQYERVIPDGNNEKIVLDNKALISKIKDLKKDGGITKKDSYVTMDIQGNNLMLDGVKVGDVSAANFEGENSDYINLDADILTSYLSGDKTDLYSSKDSSKAMYFGNGSAINIIMPQRKTESHIDANGKETIKQRRKDYESMRKDKEIGDEAKANKKAAQKLANQGYVDDIVNGYKRSVPANFEEKSIEKLKEWTTEQLQRMYKVANADIDSLMEKKDFNSDSFSSFCYKNFDMSPHNLIGQNYAMKDHPAIVREIERLVTERGGKLEKSLFDGFLGLELLEEDVDDIEEEKEEESLWNDYSAEQPELFNSVELQVTEAMNRHFGNCL